LAQLSPRERKDWQRALDATRPAWLAGWQRETPPRSEQAVLRLASLAVAA